VSRTHIDHKDIVSFANDRVNLPKAKADEYRAQVRRLREKLEAYLSDHPDFTLRKMLLSGSLAKGTALRTLNDIDVAVYVSGSDSLRDISALLQYIVEKLRTAFPNVSPDQVQRQTYSVTFSFRGTGLDVDVVPILYYDDPDWRGDLVSQDDGSFLETSIPLHFDFIRKRKRSQETHFAQVVRLAKFWVHHMKQEHQEFRFKSFMVELLMSHLCDQGVDFSDYPDALQSFFTYIAKTNMRERIVFTDYPSRPTVAPPASTPLQIIDPVNSENNVARLYTEAHADAIVDAALDAGDALEYALSAQTKQETVRSWQRVFGPSFHV
jgi:tRNA nucleotidyltransferase (CCA-adding enzyme)